MRSRLGSTTGRRGSTTGRRLLTAACLLLLAGTAACSGTGSSGAGAGSGGSAGSSATSAAVQPIEESSSGLDSIESQRPRPGDCHAMTLEQVTATSADGTSSDCLHGPTTVTVAVRSLTLHGRRLAAGSTAAQALMHRTCRPRAASWLGTDVAGLRLSRLTAVWFVPSAEQADAGARWFRCDVVGFDRGNHLIPLPAPHQLEGVLGTDAGARYALCGTARPGDKRFQRVTCSLKHIWKAIGTVDLPGGKAYPGQARVRAAGDHACSKKARAASGRATTYDYGWEWPTAQQWRAGQHYGYCWAPA